MRKKIFYSLFLMTFIVLLFATSIFLWISYRQTTAENKQCLKVQANLLMLLEERVDFDYEILSRARVKDRITVLAPDGSVLFDNYVDATTMENHLDRDEIQLALEGNDGFVTRLSETLDKEVIYYAVRLNNGNVMRLARTNDTIYTQFKNVIWYSVITVLFILAGAFFAARRITANVIAPLENLDLEHPQKGKAYPELRPVLKRLANQQKMRREFSANVSHELKTPLQSVLGYSEIMLNGLVKEEDRQRFLQKIYDEAKNLLRLIDDIIRLSKLDEQQKNFTEEFDLRMVIERAFERLQDKALKHDVELFLGSTVEAMPMVGSQAMLEEVFTNLLDNAIKYNHCGGSVFVAMSESERKWIVTIKDTGIGIAEDEQDRIFERFYRVDKSRHRDGTGLGLSIVKHGVMIHRGLISVHSNLETGTEIVVKLPKNE